MGQGKSTLNNAPLYNEAEYEVSPKRNDSRYGNILPLTNKSTRAELVVVTKTLQQEEELIQRLAELDIRERLHHPNLVQLLRKNSRKQDDFCSTFYELGLLYEYWTGNLKNEIAERRNVSIGYQEGELWYLAESLLSVVHYLKTEGLTHGDIRPYNVMLTQQGTVKLGEVFIYTRSISAFSQLLNHQLDEYYVSPEQFHRLKSVREAVNQDYDINKSEIFAVGVTLLEAATLEDVSYHVYDKENYVINTVNLNHLLEIVQQQYSFQFASFLAKLLRENEQERPHVEELLGELQLPSIAQQKYSNITLIDLLNLNVQDLQEALQNQQQQAEQYEEKVVRSAPAPAAAQQQEQQQQYLPQPVEPVQQQQQIVTSNNDMDDLNARIQAVLAMSRDTIARYGAASSSTVATSQPSQVTYSTQQQQQTYTQAPVIYNIPSEVKASHIETRTFLNENTNTIETRVYQPYSEQLEDVIKRSQKPQSPDQFTSQPTFGNTNNSEVLPSQAVNSSSAQASTYQLPQVQSSYTVPTVTATTTTTTYALPEQTSTTRVPAAPINSYQTSYVSNVVPTVKQSGNYVDYTTSIQPQQTYSTSSYTSGPLTENNQTYISNSIPAYQSASNSNNVYNFVPSSINANPTIQSYSNTTYLQQPSVTSAVTEVKPVDSLTKKEQDDYIQKLIESMKLKNAEQQGQQQQGQNTTTYQTYTQSSYANNN